MAKYIKFFFSFLLVFSFISIEKPLFAEAVDPLSLESQPSAKSGENHSPNHSGKNETGFKEGWIQVGKGFKNVGKATGRGIKKGAVVTGKGIKKGAVVTGKGIKKATLATGRGFKKAGKKIKNSFSKKDNKGDLVEESDLGSSNNGEYNSDLTDHVGDRAPDAKTSSTSSENENLN